MKTCSYCGRENAEDAVRCLECGTPFATEATESEMAEANDPVRLRRTVAERKMFIGVASFIVGILVTAISYSAAANNPAGGTYIIAYGAIVYGVMRFIQGYTSKDIGPSNDDLAYAELSHGTRLEAEGRVKAALAVYQSVIDQYPESEASRDAQKSIDALRDSPSLSEPDQA